MTGPAKRVVTGTYAKIDGTPNSGYVEFTPTSDILKQGTAIIHLSTVTAYLDSNGTFQCELAVTDDTTWIPNGWVWSIEEKITNGRVWWFAVPTDGSPLDISLLYNPGTAPPTVNTQGGKGDPGPSNVLSVESTTTGAAGTDAVVTISGTSPAQQLSFVIPQGEKGEKGDPGGAATDHSLLIGLEDPDHPISAIQGLQDALNLKANITYVNSRTPQVTVSNVAPSNPAVGDVWIDTN